MCNIKYILFFLSTLYMVDSSVVPKKKSDMSLQRLTALRALMANQSKPLAAYIVPTADAHNNEYISPSDARREWLSEFTGSAGTAVVTASKALVWTDGRYYTQFEQQVDLTLWTLMKQSLPETPSMEKWLSTNLTEGSVVGADPTTLSRNEWTPLKQALSKANMELVALPNNLVDEARKKINDTAPPRPSNPILVLPVEFTGKKCGEKVADLRKKMQEKKTSALVLTALHEIAYVLNLRGSDIQYNPLFFSYFIIKPDKVVLFWKDGVLSEDVSKHFADEQLDGVTVLPYKDVFKYLEDMANELSENGDARHSVWLSHDSSEAIHSAASGGDSVAKPLELISEVSPVSLAKMIKNKVELQGFRNCHIRDGVAVIRFFHWLHQQIDNGIAVTEVQASDKLLEFRQKENHFKGPSFQTIAGAGEHGAIIHYFPTPEGPQRVITGDDMFLLDSGGQYLDGTTDITRTRHMGTPTAEQIESFTRVLKGQIRMGSSLFPAGVKGNVLDSFARMYLWDVGLDYAHGTGHGVGHFLNVHEGPSGISWRAMPDDPGVTEGSIYSNEPGYYEKGKYGIRHEDLVEVISVTKETEHPRASGLIGNYDGRGVLGFRTITMVPNQKKSIDVKLLDDFELKYTNDYHKLVLDTIGPILKERGFNEEFKWLEKECEPLKRE